MEFGPLPSSMYVLSREEGGIGHQLEAPRPGPRLRQLTSHPLIHLDFRAADTCSERPSCFHGNRGKASLSTYFRNLIKRGSRTAAAPAAPPPATGRLYDAQVMPAPPRAGWGDVRGGRQMAEHINIAEVLKAHTFSERCEPTTVILLTEII